LKRIFSLVITIALLIFGFSSTYISRAAATFDDISGHWAETDILNWANQGIFTGIDGHFSPNNPITRAQFAVILSRIMNYSDNSVNPYTFTDLPQGTWFTNAIVEVQKFGIYLGYDDGTIRPNEDITRGEMCVFLCRILGIPPISTPLTFTDSNQIASFALPYVSALVHNGIINGFEDGTFKPTAPITRAEATHMLSIGISYVIKTTKTDFSADNAIVSMSNIAIQNAKISNNLIISESLNGGKCLISGAKIGNLMIVRGGGYITIAKNSYINNLDVENNESLTTIEIDEGCNIVSLDASTPCHIINHGDITIINSLCDNVSIEGNIPNLGGTYSPIITNSVTPSPQIASINSNDINNQNALPGEPNGGGIVIRPQETHPPTFGPILSPVPTFFAPKETHPAMVAMSPTCSPSATPAFGPTCSPTSVSDTMPTETATLLPSISPSPAHMATPQIIPTITTTPSPSNSPISTHVATPQIIPTATVVPLPSVSPSPTYVAIPSLSPTTTPVKTPYPTVTPTVSPFPTESPIPSTVFSPTPTITPIETSFPIPSELCFTLPNNLSANWYLYDYGEITLPFQFPSPQNIEVAIEYPTGELDDPTEISQWQPYKPNVSSYFYYDVKVGKGSNVWINYRFYVINFYFRLKNDSHWLVYDPTKEPNSDSYYFK